MTQTRAQQADTRMAPADAARVACVCGGFLSTVLALAALGLWVAHPVTGNGGYNSSISAIIAGGHVALSSACLLLLRVLPRATQRNLLGGVVFSAYMFVSTVTYAELLAGVFFWRIPPRETAYVADPTVGWRLRSNYIGTYLGKDLRTNSDGFRSPELSVEKGENTTRVVCLGDSLTFGHGLAEQDAYPQRLQEFLNERVLAYRWEVINAGMEGFCTFQETEELRRCLKYTPDVVVVLFCLNDVTEKYLALSRFGGTGLEYHGVADGSAGRWFQVLVRMRSYSALVTALTPTATDARRREIYSVRMLWEQPDREHIREAWTQAEGELDELHAVCQKHELRLILAVAPVLEQFADTAGIDAPQRRLHRYAHSRGIEYVDLRASFAARTAQRGVGVETLYMDGIHPNAAGSALIAEVIADRIGAKQ